MNRDLFYTLADFAVFAQWGAFLTLLVTGYRLAAAIIFATIFLTLFAVVYLNARLQLDKSGSNVYNYDLPDEYR